MATRIFFLLFIGISLQTVMAAQPYSSIKGEGKVVTQEIKLDPIHGVGLSFHGEVVLTQGKTQQVVVEAQQNIIDNIKRQVKNGFWNIEFDKHVKDAEPVKITITLPVLDEIDINGSGSISSSNHFNGLHDLDINIAGSGNLHFDYDAKDTEFNLSGSGKAELTGKTSELDINISGSGTIKARELESSACEVAISGSGHAFVNVNGDLKAAVSGSGDVFYTGKANVDANISGSGKVTKSE
jgi:hypothetical protein